MPYIYNPNWINIRDIDHSLYDDDAILIIPYNNNITIYNINSL